MVSQCFQIIMDFDFVEVKSESWKEESMLQMTIKEGSWEHHLYKTGEYFVNRME